MIYLMIVAALGLIAFGWWLGLMKMKGIADARLRSMNDFLEAYKKEVSEKMRIINQHSVNIDERDAARAERDDLTEQNRRLRNQITAQQLALGLAGQEFNYVPKKVVAAHYAVKALKR